jgi:uncharacterized glyoxalase superfamily protein PhnB
MAKKAKKAPKVKKAKPKKAKQKKAKAKAKAKKVKPIPKGSRSVTPHLIVQGADQAIDFYTKAFGAKEIMRAPGPGGKIMHAEMEIGDSQIYLAEEFPQMGSKSPLAYHGTPVTIHLWFKDVDSAFQQAVDAGAKVLMPLADQFWGDRFGMVTDPFGHQWSLSTHVKDLSMEEMMAAMPPPPECAPSAEQALSQAAPEPPPMSVPEPAPAMS